MDRTAWCFHCSISRCSVRDWIICLMIDVCNEKVYELIWYRGLNVPKSAGKYFKLEAINEWVASEPANPSLSSPYLNNQVGVCKFSRRLRSFSPNDNEKV
jgi:hypothetical protein